MCAKGSSEKERAVSNGSRRRLDAAGAGHPKPEAEEDVEDVADSCGQRRVKGDGRLTGCGGSGGGWSASLLALLDLKMAEGCCLGDISADERSMLGLLEPQVGGMDVA